ncbi:MAG: TIGR04222 domain-containing membrane protein [Planctomycetes bacterium]|nr:TIGR04222 domain-containing membrane protein [Planctomycetota bacterium]
MNPFELPGPAFLALYVGVALAATALAAAARALLRPPGGEPSRMAKPLDAYEIAYLEGGAETAIHAAVAGLFHAQALDATGDDRCVAAVAPLPRDPHPPEAEVHRELDAIAAAVRRGETRRGLAQVEAGRAAR